MTQLTSDKIWEILQGVMDPEIPVISIVDLGIIRDVEVTDTTTRVVVTPTYSGCPATAVIQREIRSALEAAGVTQLVLETILSPAWTTDWISEAGKQKLLEFGIAPPHVSSKLPILSTSVACPRCGTTDTALKSEFSGTPCKALYVCNTCREPFELFKCI